MSDHREELMVAGPGPKEHFGASRPASTRVEVARLVRDDLLIEMKAAAVLPEGR